MKAQRIDSMTDILIELISLLCIWFMTATISDVIVIVLVAVVVRLMLKLSRK